MGTSQLTSEATLDHPVGNQHRSDFHRRTEVEEWFLRRGMPAVTRSSSGLRSLLLRAVPVLIGYIVVYLAITAIDMLLRELEPEVFATFADPATVLPTWYYIALGTGFVLALVAGIIANWRIRGRPLRDRTRHLLIIGVPVLVFLLPVADHALGLADADLVDVIGTAILIAVVLLLIRSGLGAVLIWSLRQALRQGSALTTLAARALPMIVLVTIFAFLSEGMWRVTGALSRGELWNAVLILTVIAAVFVWSVTRGEMRGLAESPHCTTEEILAQQFPAHAIDLTIDEADRPTDLNTRESANAIIILFIAQAIQLGFLAVLVFTFFCVFGSITVPPSVMAVWTGHDATIGTLMGVRLPVYHELIQTSLFLAAFSAVNFAASSLTDPVYRQNFFEPILRDMRITIAARHLYRASERLDARRGT